MKFWIGLYLLCSLGVQSLWAQDDELIAVSGLLYQEGTNISIPYANVQILHQNDGTISAANGFFSIVCERGDTLQISSIGYRTLWLEVPDTIVKSRATIMVPMTIDTVMLEEAVVYPWPSREQFREAFLALETHNPPTLTMMPIPGIRAVPNPVPIEPHPFWNAASFFYEELFLKTLDKLPKKKKAETLPVWE